MIGNGTEILIYQIIAICSWKNSLENLLEEMLIFLTIYDCVRKIFFVNKNSFIFLAKEKKEKKEPSKALKNEFEKLKASASKAKEAYIKKRDAITPCHSLILLNPKLN